MAISLSKINDTTMTIMTIMSIRQIPSGVQTIIKRLTC